MKSPWFRLTLEERLQEVLAVHFDPVQGTKYWLEREKELGIDVRKEIKTLTDLAIFGPMDQEALPIIWGPLGPIQSQFSPIGKFLFSAT